jgi:hypothetical protein
MKARLLVALIFLFSAAAVALEYGRFYPVDFYNDKYVRIAEVEMAPLSNGGFVISWVRSDATWHNMQVMAKLFSAQGEQVSNEIQVDPFAMSIQGDMNLAASDNGFAITWIGNSHAYNQFFNNDGSKRGDWFVPTRETNDYSAIAFGLNGNYLLCWSWPNFSNMAEVHAQMYRQNGEKYGATLDLGGYGIPHVTALPDSNFAVCWAGGDWSKKIFGIVGQIISKNGEKIGESFLA